MTDFEPQPRYLPLPLHQPIFTYPLLGAIGLIWLFITAQVGGGDNYTRALVYYGANYGPYILSRDEVWRFFTSMFLHGSLLHVSFNSYALYIFGLEIERIYGAGRFIVIYMLAGLFGSLASFATHGDQTFSVGASGAIFGLIGMNLAFFWLHRDKMGEFGRQKISSTLSVIVINLILGATIPRIDNFAHIGGLISGTLLGLALAPRYRTVAVDMFEAELVDTVTWLNRSWVIILALLILAAGTWLALNFWS
jgi:rhomboid protease GluP